MANNHDIARHFLLMGIQHWGQSTEKREEATRDYVQAAGLTFGTPESDAWLNIVLDSLVRGEFNSEARQLCAALDARDGGKSRKDSRIQSAGDERRSLGGTD